MSSADDWKLAAARGLGVELTDESVTSPEVLRETLAALMSAALGSQILLEVQRYVQDGRTSTLRLFKAQFLLSALPPLGAVLTRGELTYHVRTLSCIDGVWTSAESLTTTDTADYREECSNMIRVGWREEQLPEGLRS